MPLTELHRSTGTNHDLAGASHCPARHLDPMTPARNELHEDIELQLFTCDHWWIDVGGEG
jgi:hypothetical protein